MALGLACSKHKKTPKKLSSIVSLQKSWLGYEILHRPCCEQFPGGAIFLHSPNKEACIYRDPIKSVLLFPKFRFNFSEFSFFCFNFWESRFFFLFFYLLLLSNYQKQYVFNVNDEHVHKLYRNYLKWIAVTNIFPQYCTVQCSTVHQKHFDFNMSSYFHWIKTWSALRQIR